MPQAVPFGTCTRSLGRCAAGHYLPAILQACADSGLWVVEVAYECLEGYAQSLCKSTSPVTGNELRDAIRQAARQTARIAHELGLVLAVLDAFENYEGCPDRQRHAALVDEWRFWVELCGIMGIEIIQVPASYDPAASSDLELVVSDLRVIADIGLEASPPVKIAYEPLGWSTHFATWEKALEVCHRVDRDNIGLCLDTFHITSLLWGSPEIKGGRREDGDEALRASLARLRKIDPKDIFVFQLSDAMLLDPPMPAHPFTEPNIDRLFAWSMHGRPHPYEGHHPVLPVCEAVFATGFRGYTIMETFEDEGYEKRPSVVIERAQKAVNSWIRLGAHLKLAPYRPPSRKGENKLGTCSVNIGHYEYYTLEDKLYAAAAAGHQAIDLYEDDFLYYLSLQAGANQKNLWEPNAVHLHSAKKIGDLCAGLGMEIICFQPLIDVEGLVFPEERAAAVERVKAYFPFMRALRTNVTYITTNRRYDFDNITADMTVIAQDLATFADLAADYAKADGGPMLYVGYEHLSWGSHINTFDKTWEAIKLADRSNLGFVFDTFNFLAVEYADPLNPAGHGRLLSTPEESRDAVRQRLAQLVKLIPGDKILVCQVADARLVDPKTLPRPTPASEPWTKDHEPPYRYWSTSHRLFPNEQALGGYMPVADCLAAILATGYKGALTLEIFNDSIFEQGPHVIHEHAQRAYKGLASCVEEAKVVPAFW